MSFKHYFIIKKDNKKVFEEQILGNDDYFDDEFYEKLNIKIEDDIIKLTEIQIEDLFVEWINWLERNPEINGVSFGYKIKELNNFEKYQHLLSCDYYCIQPFLLLHNIKKFLSQSNENLFKDYGKLKNGYKAYIKGC